MYIYIWLYKETPPLILEFTRTRAEPVARTRTPAERPVERRYRWSGFQATANPCRDHLHRWENYALFLFGRQACAHLLWSIWEPCLYTPLLDTPSLTVELIKHWRHSKANKGRPRNKCLTALTECQPQTTTRNWRSRPLLLRHSLVLWSTCKINCNISTPNIPRKYIQTSYFDQRNSQKKVSLQSKFHNIPPKTHFNSRYSTYPCFVSERPFWAPLYDAHNGPKSASQTWGPQLPGTFGI